MNKSLVIPNQGVVWNFPATGSGRLTVKIKFPEGSKGGRISLLDRWVNATDKWSHHYAMYNLKVNKGLTIGDKARFTPGKWQDLRFEWRSATGAEKGTALCSIYLDGVRLADGLPLIRKTVNGISYIHLISGDERDPHGFSISSMSFSGLLAGKEDRLAGNLPRAASGAARRRFSW